MILNSIQNINFGYNSIKSSYPSKISKTKETLQTQQDTMLLKEAFAAKGEAEFALYHSKNIKKQAQDMALIAQNAKCNAKELYEEKRELIKLTFDELQEIDFDEDGHYYETYGEPNGTWQLHKAWSKDRNGKITMKEFDENGILIKEKEVEYRNSCAMTISTIDPKTGQKDVVAGYTNGFFGCEVNEIMIGYEKTQDGYKADEVYTFAPKDSFDKLINFEVGYTKTKNSKTSEISFDFKDYHRNQSKGFTCETGVCYYKDGAMGFLARTADSIYSYGHSGEFYSYSTGVKSPAISYSAQPPAISYKEDYTFDSFGNLRIYETGKHWVGGKERKANSRAEFDGNKVSKINIKYLENYERNIISSEGEFHF